MLCNLMISASCDLKRNNNNNNKKNPDTLRDTGYKSHTLRYEPRI